MLIYVVNNEIMRLPLSFNEGGNGNNERHWERTLRVGNLTPYCNHPAAVGSEIVEKYCEKINMFLLKKEENPGWVWAHLNWNGSIAGLTLHGPIFEHLQSFCGKSLKFKLELHFGDVEHPSRVRRDLKPAQGLFSIEFVREFPPLKSFNTTFQTDLTITENGPINEAGLPTVCFMFSRVSNPFCEATSIQVPDGFGELWHSPLQPWGLKIRVNVILEVDDITKSCSIM